MLGAGVVRSHCAGSLVCGNPLLAHLSSQHTESRDSLPARRFGTPSDRMHWSPASWPPDSCRAWACAGQQTMAFGAHHTDARPA